MWAKHNFLSIFKSFLSVSKQGSFFNVHFQILSALARKFRSFRAHQCSSDQMQILKDHNAHTTRALGIAYRLWLPFSINTVFNLTKLKNITHTHTHTHTRTHTHTHIYIYILHISVIFGYISIIHIYCILYIYQINTLYHISKYQILYMHILNVIRIHYKNILLIYKIYH